MESISGLKYVKDGSGEAYYFHDWNSPTTFSANIEVPQPEELKQILSRSIPVGRDIQDVGLEIQNKIAYDIDQNVLDKIFQEMANRFNQVPIVKHVCHGCGATIEMDADRHLFTCGYCGSAYAVGTAQIYS